MMAAPRKRANLSPQARSESADDRNPATARATPTSRCKSCFIHMDQMGEIDYAPGEPKGTPWHPHRGFETVTYMLDGIFQHQDSNGGGFITDGDTQRATAGAVTSISSSLSCANVN
jgi:redox-sensitive bicupin YhaK (pirin superfamily)